MFVEIFVASAFISGYVALLYKLIRHNVRSNRESVSMVVTYV